MVLECAVMLPLVGSASAGGSPVANSVPASVTSATATATVDPQFAVEHNFKQPLIPFPSANGVRVNSLQVMSPYSNTASIGSVDCFVELVFWVD